MLPREARSASRDGGQRPMLAKMLAGRGAHTERQTQNIPLCRPFFQADARTRTGDPFITSEVLYQLSYVGAGASLARNPGRS